MLSDTIDFHKDFIDFMCGIWRILIIPYGIRRCLSKTIDFLKEFSDCLPGILTILAFLQEFIIWHFGDFSIMIWVRNYCSGHTELAPGVRMTVVLDKPI